MLQSYFHAIIFKLFVLWCRLQTIINEFIKNILEKNNELNAFVVEMMYMIKCVRCFMIGQRLESRDIPWINTYALQCYTPNKSIQKSLLEDETDWALNYVNNTYTLVETVSSFYNEDGYDGYDEIFGNNSVQCITDIGSRIDPNQLSPLIVIKCWNNKFEEDMYLVRRGPFNETNNMIPFSNKKGPVKFLLIEYNHPEMIESIELVFNASWFIVGNELFSPSFVLRALEYQSQSYYFDHRYTLRMMDNNFDMMEIGPHTYIEITEEGYTCKNDDIFPVGSDSETESDEHNHNHTHEEEQQQEDEEDRLYTEFLDKKFV